ncbi:MAG: aspartate 1-decarboxylase [Brevinematales bacterium]|jgi:aspartate 1-decarboxylase
MLLTVLRAKIHRAVVTETNLEYIGSITIDESLMLSAGIYPYEQVHVWNLTNGARLVTYAIPGESGSGIICLNGAGAHLNRVGDRVIIAAFGQVDEKEAGVYNVKIISVDDNNKLKQVL